MRTVAVLLAVGLFGCGGGGGSSGMMTAPGCDDSKYDNFTGKPMVELAIIESSSAPPEYSTKCFAVSAGTMVVLPAGSKYPLQGEADIGGVANPFRGASPAMANTTQTLTAPGYYGFYCTAFGKPDGTGMAGAIHVVP
jgi:hypothetical protein